jgi:hypothetical protein
MYATNPEKSKQINNYKHHEVAGCEQEKAQKIVEIRNLN